MKKRIREVILAKKVFKNENKRKLIKNKKQNVTGVLDYDKTIRDHKCLIAFQIFYQNMLNVL